MSLAITDDALIALKEILENVEQRGDRVLRVVQDGEGNLTFALDAEKEGDMTVKKDDTTVMVLDQDFSDALDGFTLDVQETPQGKLFVLLEAEVEEGDEE